MSKIPKCHPEGKYYAKGLCTRCYANRRSAKNRQQIRQKTPDRHLRERYGITRDELEQMIKDRQSKCDLCDKETDKFDVDHDHMTGRVRGLLCRRCNHALGGYELLVGNPRLSKYLEDPEDS